MNKVKYILTMLFALIITGCITVNAGKDQVVHSGDNVVLNGSLSRSIDNRKIKYVWKQTKGPKVALQNVNSQKASFIAPDVTKNTSLKFLLTVSTIDGRSNNRDSVSIMVKAVQEADTTPPIITLHGDVNITLVQGTIYTDSGATVTDNRDNNITVVTQGSVDTNTPGIYTLTYSATDAAGNVALEVSRTVTVLESNDNNDSNSTKITISGKVVDINGIGIENALVTIGNHIFTTDSNGTYSTGEIASSERISVNVRHPAYLKNSRIIVTTAHNASMDITLDRPKATLTFDSSAGATLTENSGASVTLPADGYIDENGLTYTGSVTVNMAYYPITTQSGRDTFPGTFEGTDGNTTFPIQSYGFMNVELTDANGNPLNLDGNATATLRYPIDTSLRNPSSIPLWYYDEILGYWIEEGEAILNNDINYIGTVKHFTPWNLGKQNININFAGCVENENGVRIPNASIIFRTQKWESRYINCKTNVNGIGYCNIPATNNITFSASKIINGTVYAGTHPEKINLEFGNEAPLPTSCIVLKKTTAPNTKKITIKGHVAFINTNNTGSDHIIPKIQVYGLYTKINILDKVAKEGKFSLTIPINKYDTGFSIGISPSCDWGKTFFLEEDKSIYDIGEIAFIPVC